MKKKSKKNVTVHAKAKTEEKPLFREGSNYAVIVKLGSRRPVKRATLIKKVVAKTGQTENAAEEAIKVLCNPNHRSNRNKVKNVTGSKEVIHFAPCGE